MTSNEWRKWLNAIIHFNGAIYGVSASNMRAYIKVILFDRTFGALVKTGTTVNLIGKEIAGYLSDDGIQFEPTIQVMRMANSLNSCSGQLNDSSGPIAGSDYD